MSSQQGNNHHDRNQRDQPSRDERGTASRKRRLESDAGDDDNAQQSTNNVDALVGFQEVGADEKVSASSRPSPKTRVPSPTKPTAKGRKKKSKDMPSRPLSAYNLFFRDKRQSLLAEIEGNASKDDDGKTSKFSAMGQMVASKWKEISKEERSHFEQLAKEDMKRYQQELDGYRVKQAGKRKQEEDVVPSVPEQDDITTAFLQSNVYDTQHQILQRQQQQQQQQQQEQQQQLQQLEQQQQQQSDVQGNEVLQMLLSMQQNQNNGAQQGFSSLNNFSQNGNSGRVQNWQDLIQTGNANHPSISYGMPIDNNDNNNVMQQLQQLSSSVSNSNHQVQQLLAQAQPQPQSNGLNRVNNAQAFHQSSIDGYMNHFNGTNSHDANESRQILAQNQESNQIYQNSQQIDNYTRPDNTRNTHDADNSNLIQQILQLLALQGSSQPVQNDTPNVPSFVDLLNILSQPQRMESNNAAPVMTQLPEPPTAAIQEYRSMSDAIQRQQTNSQSEPRSSSDENETSQPSIGQLMQQSENVDASASNFILELIRQLQQSNQQ